MVLASTIFSTLAFFITAIAGQDIMPPDMAWQTVDTHSSQSDCLLANNRQCDVVDIAKVTLDSNTLINSFSKSLDGSDYSNDQFRTDTENIANSWGRTANVLTASLPVVPARSYQRLAAGDMVHWSQALPLVTVFKGLQSNKSKVQHLDPNTINYGVQMLLQQSNNLATGVVDYAPEGDDASRQQAEYRQKWLSEEFNKMLAAFPGQ